NDPLKFFEQLDNPHQFGGRAPRPPHEHTLLERIHAWKRSLRVSVRLALRGQFTEPPSAHFKSILPRESKPVSRETHFAEAPVLNSQQLVLSFVQPVHSARRWEAQNVEIGVREKGVYLVEAVRGELRAYTVLMVSDIVMITKTGRSGIMTFVVDRSTGKPIPDAEVSMFTREAEPSLKTNTIKTNADGIAELPVPAGRTENLRVLTRRGADVAFSVPNFYYGVDREQWSGYVYTDRPVYRPGHTVHFKGIFRLRAPVGYEVPSARNVSIEIKDSEQKSIYRKTLTTSVNGTIQDELALAPLTSLGSYYIEARGAEYTMSGSFEVEEYKKPEYEVRVTPSKSRVLQGESVDAVIEARYYFGEPVNGAKVKYAVYRSRYWFPLWYEPDEEQPEQGEGEGNERFGDQNEQVLEADGQLDQDGKLSVKIPTTESEHKVDYRYRIEARVTDQAKREIAGTGWLIATHGSFLVNIRPDRYFYEPATKATFTVEARDYDNKPIETPAHVELLTWDWRNRSTSDVKASTDVKTGADGSAPAELMIPRQGGSYQVRVTARTPEGRDVEQSTYLWVSGMRESEFFYDQGRKTIQIIPDKKSYRPGDVAKLLIITGKPGTPVLLSIEGRDLRTHQLIRSKDSTAVYEVPISLNDEPGIFVTAQFIRSGDLYLNSKLIKVPPEEHKLNVKLATGKPQYLPGETATYNIDVTGPDGKPASRVDLSLGVIDEAIYAIRRDSMPEMINFFFGREWNSVFTESSLNYYFSGEAGKRRMRLAELRPPSRLAQLKPERLVQPKVRKAFPDTAFWAADIITDASGHAQAKVPFPDSLTTWRATARGITPDTKVGNSVLKTIVRKNLILRLAVPVSSCRAMKLFYPRSSTIIWLMQKRRVWRSKLPGSMCSRARPKRSKFPAVAKPRSAGAFAPRPCAMPPCMAKLSPRKSRMRSSWNCP
ncbi:MAG: alpha-2-macroglobulin, partial [Acidobacteria bacterium]